MSEEVYPIMLYTKSTAMDETTNRRNIIIQIMDVLHKMGKAYDTVLIRKELAKRGYYVDKTTIREDITVINKYSSFVLDLARWNYNGMVEYMFDNIESSIRQSDEIIDTEWTQSKIVTKNVQSFDGAFESKEEVITTAIAGPKNQAIRNKIQAMKLYTDIFKGGIIDVSIAILDRNINRIVDENRELKEKQTEQLELINKLQKRSNNNDHMVDKDGVSD